MAETTRTGIRARTMPARNRLTADVVLAILVVAALVMIAAASGSSTGTPSVTRTVVISSGETLWALASENRVDGLSIEQTVDLIVRMNALEDSDISVGQRIMLPASTDASALAMR